MLAASERLRSRARQVPRAAARHSALLVLLTAGLVLRAVVVYAYEPAFYFPDSLDFLYAAGSGEPLPHRPVLYSAFIAAVDAVLPFRAVIVVQHLVGLATGALVYALLVHRGVRRGWACLAVVPLVLDGYLLALEHYVLAETLLMAELAGAFALLLWRERPGWRLCAGAGLLLGASVVTRNVGAFVAAAVGVYLVVRFLRRSVHWSAVVGFAAGAAVVVLGYSAYFLSWNGTFATTTYTGYYLYARVTAFVECERIDVPPRLRGLCPQQPLETRPHPDFYAWDRQNSPAYTGGYTEADLRAFARVVVQQQTRDYLRTTGEALWKYVQPGRRDRRIDVCSGWYDFPVAPADQPVCEARLSQVRTGLEPTPTTLRPGPAAFLRDYQQDVHVSGPVLGGLAVLTLLGLARPRVRRADRLDALLLLSSSVLLVAAPSVTALFDYRYAVPMFVTLPAAAALATRRRPPAEPGPTARDDPGEPEPVPRAAVPVAVPGAAGLRR